MHNVPAEPVVGMLAAVWSSIDEACEGLDAAEWEIPTDCPGWTVRDQVSHLIGTERLLAGDAGPLPLEPQPDYVRNAIGEMNEAWVAARRGLPGEAVLAEFDEVTARRLDQLGARSTEEFDVVGWSPVGQVPYREFMVVRVFDCFIHEQDIRRALGRPGGRGGPGERVALDQISQSMGYIVGRRVAPPEGTSVVFEVTGPDPRTVALVIEGGRAKPPAEVPAHPSVRLGMDAPVFWRLGGGRVSAEAVQAQGEVDVVGDQELGAKVLGAMAFMI